MLESYQAFPHINLKLTTEGRAASPPRGRGQKSQITLVNLNNRGASTIGRYTSVRRI
jgi:hypothetical protein